MELLVEVVHGDESTDVALEVEPGASFGDVADSLAFLHHVRDGATLTVARTGETPRRDDRVADVDVRSGRPPDARRLDQRPVLGDAGGGRRDARRVVAERAP